MGKSLLSNCSIAVKASVVYTICSLLTRGLGIITIPIFTRLMSSEQIGLVNLFASWTSTLEVFATLSLTSGGFAVAMKEFPDDRDGYLSSVLFLTSFISSILLFIYIIFHAKISKLTGLSNPLMILMLVGFIFTPANEFFLAKQRYEYKYKIAGIITTGSAVIASVCSVCSVIYASKKGIKNLGEIRLFSTSIITYFVSAVIWGYVFVKGRYKINFDYLKFSLKLSIPLMGNSIASQILNVSDRMMISKLVGNSAVGVYSILYSASALSLIVWYAINNSFVPFLFDGINKVEKQSAIRKTSLEILIAYAGFAFILTLVAPEIIRFLATDEYYEAIYIMPPIAAGIFLTSMHCMYANVILYYKKSIYIMIATSFAALTNVVLNYFGIKKFGFMAAAYTTLIAHVVLVLIQGIVARRIHSTKTNTNSSVYNDYVLFLLCLVTVVLCMSCIPLYNFVVIRYLIIIFLIFCAFVFRRNLLAVLSLKC